jgi:predicted phosphohydrolase
MSDLHLEFGPLTGALPVGEVLILAGDVNVKGRCDEINDLAGGFEHVIYVAGNHEYYKGSIDTIDNKIRDNLVDNIHFLQNDFVEINGVRFIGATLWTDYFGGDPMSMFECGRCMSDHHVIRIDSSYRKFRPEDAAFLHRRSVDYIKELTREGDVVITHHAPCALSIGKKFKGNSLNGGYYTDLTELMFNKKPKYWIHGHMHETSNYMIGDTNVLCNPKGYTPNYENPYFNINRRFEV